MLQEINSAMERMLLSLSDWALKHGGFILGVYLFILNNKVALKQPGLMMILGHSTHKFHLLQCVVDPGKL